MICENYLIWQNSDTMSEKHMMEGSGRAIGVAVALQHMIWLLQKRGIISIEQIHETLDNALEEARTLPMEPEQGAEAARAIGLLFVPPKPRE